MADTGAPWNIPYQEPADIVRDYPAASEDLADAIAAGLSAAGGGFDDLEVITATNASWPVPSLASPIVKVTVIGGGGGGGGSGTGTGTGGSGGTTTFAVGQAYEFSATGGVGGNSGTRTGTQNGSAGLASGNGGGARTNSNLTGNPGNGGFIVTQYCDITGATVLNLVVGAGGSGGTGASGNGFSGGRGEIIVEYAAG